MLACLCMYLESLNTDIQSFITHCKHLIDFPSNLRNLHRYINTYYICMYPSKVVTILTIFCSMIELMLCSLAKKYIK